MEQFIEPEGVDGGNLLRNHIMKSEIADREVPVETLTLMEAARYLNISDKTLLEMVDAGEVPAAKPGRAWVFYLPFLRDYLIKKTEEETAARREGKTPLYITREVRRVTKAGCT